MTPKLTRTPLVPHILEHVPCLGMLTYALPAEPLMPCTVAEALQDLLSMSDSELLLNLSTSPFAEAPNFPDAVRACLRASAAEPVSETRLEGRGRLTFLQ